MTSDTQQSQAVPSGYLQDSAGRLVPETKIKPIDLARDALVRELATKAEKLSAALAEFKRTVFEDVYAFVDLSAEQYGATFRGRQGKGNLTLSSYDGALKVQVAIAERLTFDERLQAAKALIDECIHEWTSGSSDEIKALIAGAFQVDKEGKINTGRVLGLRRLDIDAPKWQAAMTAISDSLQVTGSKEYVRFYVRIGKDAYRQILLDLAAV